MIMLLLWYECVFFTNNIIRYKVCILVLNQVPCMSVFPLVDSHCELHEHVYSHCSLLWCKNGIVYQQVVRRLVLYHKSLLVYKVSYIKAFR